MTGLTPTPSSKNSQTEWHEEVIKIYDKIRSHRDPYTIQVLGLELAVLPEVFSPRYFTDSEWFADTLHSIVGSGRLLEIGTGTGIIALVAAQRGASVVATDINPAAIENAKLNFDAHHLTIPLYHGDLYQPLPQGSKFDFIFWNHPFNVGSDPNEEMLLRAGFDYNYQSLDGYVSGARDVLNENGQLLLGTGSFARLDLITEIAARHGYCLEVLARVECPIEQQGTFLNEYRIYHLLPTRT